MPDWGVVAGLISALAGVLVLVHRVVSQLMARIDALGVLLSGDMQRRFDDMERRRTEGAALFQERLDVRDQAIAELRRDHERLCGDLSSRYVSRDAFSASEGRTLITLEKIKELLSHLSRDAAAPRVPVPPPTGPHRHD